MTFQWMSSAALTTSQQIERATRATTIQQQEDAISRASLRRFWHRLGLESRWGSGVSQPCPTVLHTGLFHGTGRSIETSMALPSMPCIFALYCLVYLEFSGSEDAISRASLRTLLAPPWAWSLLGIRCFATMPHGAPQGFSMVLAGPSRHLGLCLLCLVYLPCILLCMPCNQRFRRCYFASISAHASGTALGFNPAGFHGTGWSIQTSMALPCMPSIFALNPAADPVFCNRAPTVLHTAFPWYWPVHRDIYGFAFGALYICLVLPCMPWI